MYLFQQDTGLRNVALSQSWGTASNGTVWTRASGGATGLNTTTSQLQMASPTAFMMLGQTDLHDVVMKVRASIAAVGDSPILILRYTNASNYIKTDVSGGVLRIRKNIGGTFTTIATMPFTLTPGTLYWCKFQILGTIYSSKIWADGTPEPAWLISAVATDSILSYGQWGLSATSAGLAVTYDYLTVQGISYQDNPYGVTTYNFSAATDELLTQLFSDIPGLGLTWLRFQIRLASIDNPQGTYDWSLLDAVVSACNRQHINLIFALMQAPSWGLDGTTNLPTPAYTTTICTQLALRYSGNAGHGWIDSIEIWNEEFDSSSYNNTTYPDVANAGYTALKNNGFIGKIGCAAMLGISSSAHVTNWINVLYSNSIASLFDYLNLHYYTGAEDPANPADFLSISACLSTIQAAITANNNSLKPLWITEFGYSTSTSGGHSPGSIVTPAQQNQYYSTILTTARATAPTAKIMFYSMDLAHNNTDGSSITQGIGVSETFLPAFSTVQSFIKSNASWGVGCG